MPLVNDAEIELQAISIAAFHILSTKNDYPDMQAKAIDGNLLCQKISRKYWCCQYDESRLKLIRKSQVSLGKEAYELRHSYIISKEHTGSITILRMARAFNHKIGLAEKLPEERRALVHEGDIEALGSGNFGLVKSVIKHYWRGEDLARHDRAITDELIVVKIMGMRVTEFVYNPSKLKRSELEVFAAYNGRNKTELRKALKAQDFLAKLDRFGHDISDDALYVIDKNTRAIIQRERVFNGESDSEAMKSASREVLVLNKMGRFRGAMIQDKKIYILMQRVAGQPANYRPSDFAEDPTNPTKKPLESGLDFLWYMQRVVIAVEQFHEITGYAHNDLKPQNMLDDGTIVSLIDFGAATPLAELVDLFHQGTKTYMPTIGSGIPRSDYYALGQIFLEEYPEGLTTVDIAKEIHDIIHDLKSGDLLKQDLAKVLAKMEQIIARIEQQLTETIDVDQGDTALDPLLADIELPVIGDCDAGVNSMSLQLINNQPLILEEVWPLMPVELGRQIIEFHQNSNNTGDFIRRIRQLYFDYHPDKHAGVVQEGFHEFSNFYKLISVLNDIELGETIQEILAIEEERADAIRYFGY